MFCLQISSESLENSCFLQSTETLFNCCGVKSSSRKQVTYHNNQLCTVDDNALILERDLLLNTWSRKRPPKKYLSHFTTKRTICPIPTKEKQLFKSKKTFSWIHLNIVSSFRHVFKTCDFARTMEVKIL